MKENNEVMNVNASTGEIMNSESKVQSQNGYVVEDTPTYQVVKGADGKLTKMAKYQAYSSIKAETREEKVKLYNLLNSRDGEVKEMKTKKNATITIKDVVFNPYSKFDEQTGIDRPMVNTIIGTDEGEYIATSSKGVYFDLQNMFEIFGKPDEPDYEPIKVQIIGHRTTNGEQFGLKLV